MGLFWDREEAKWKQTAYSPSSPFVNPIQVVVNQVLAYHFDGRKVKRSGYSYKVVVSVL